MMRNIPPNPSHAIQPPRQHLPLSVLLPWGFALAVLVAAGVLAFLPRAVKTQPAAPGRSGALVWGDGVFANALELEAWLRIRGASYRTWALRHPAAVKLVAPGPTPLGKKKNAPAKK